MSLLPIDKGIPVPTKKRRAATYPFLEMEIGDSFFVAGPVTRSMTCLAGMGNQRFKPRRFCSRAEDNGMRVWRVE